MNQAVTKIKVNKVIIRIVVENGGIGGKMGALEAEVVVGIGRALRFEVAVASASPAVCRLQRSQP
jgi:ribosomal protein S9